MKIRLLFVSLLLVIGLTPEEATPQATVPESSLRFAKSLVVEGEYYRAITEYRRALFFSAPEQTEQRAEAVMGIGEALYAGGEYTRAGEWLYERRADLRGTTYLEAGVSLMCRSYLAAQAGDRLREVLEDTGDIPQSEAEYFRPLALAATGDWTQARALFLGVSPDNPYRTLALKNAEAADEAVRAAWKNPSVAGWLGIVPGMGYIYADHVQTGIAALILNAVFWAASYEAFDADQDVLGGFLTFLSASWYVSSIYGSVRAAHRCNEDLQRRLWLTLKF